MCPFSHSEQLAVGATSYPFLYEPLCPVEQLDSNLSKITLKSSAHIAQITAKVNSRLRIIKNSFSILSKEILCSISLLRVKKLIFMIPKQLYQVLGPR